ncbi:MAG TPA: hypothetical protein VFS33_00660 [Gemmatimonadales bacterium]|nr:hypothetical protein [Gemmatimonadales bacterium]
MRLVDVQLVREPHTTSLVGRLEGPGDAPVRELFFRAPADGALPLGVSGDPFLAALLVPAMVAGATLEIDAPVSRRLLRRIGQIQDVLTCWYPERHRIDVVAPVRAASLTPVEGARGVGAFFSGGVDSCYTLIKSHLGWPSLADPITHLVFVKGFDATLANADGLGASAMHLQRIAAEYGRALITIETNLRDVAVAPWGEMFHGPALAAVAHCLAPGLHTMLIPASYTYDELGMPWGSHPMLDELWSSESMHVVHDGAEASRIGKLDALIHHAPRLVDRLRVCWAGNAGGPTNCGRCRKCIRAMIVLGALGYLGKTPSFPAELPANYARRYGPEDVTVLPKILAYARATGDSALVRALERRLRALIWKAGIRQLLRSHPLGAGVLDMRAALRRRLAAQRRGGTP